MTRIMSKTRRLARKILSLLLLITVCSIAVTTAKTTKSRGVNRHIKIINNAGTKIEVYWIHPQTRQTSLMSDPVVVNGAEFPLDSFVGHEFELREVPDSSGECSKSETKQCRQAFFAVSENDDQSALLNADFEVEFIDNKIKAELEASDLIQNCQAVAKQKLQDAGTDTAAAAAAVDELLACVEGGVATALDRVNEEIAFQASVRKDIAATLENYTCVDSTLNSTDDISTTTWFSEKDRKVRNVHIKHERAASKIHLIENFITDDECKTMEEFHRASGRISRGSSKIQILDDPYIKIVASRRSYLDPS